MRRAPDETVWRSLKWSCLAEALGLDPRQSPPRISATVDWFIGGQAAAQGMVLVTDDLGPEFDSVDRTTRAQLRAVLDGLCTLWCGPA